MRALFLTSVICFLGGCALLSPPREYDPVEYSLIVKVTVDVTRATHLCRDDVDSNIAFWGHMQEANADSMLLDEFSSNKGDSLALHMSVGQVRDMVNALLIRRKFSPQYCIHKLGNIQASARIISRALGQTDQHGMCDGGIRERYEAFTKSYLESKLSVSEYKELIHDIAKLVNVDTAGCDMVTRQKELQDLQMLEQILPSIMSL